MATVPSPSSGETRVRAGCGGLRAWTVPGTGGNGAAGASLGCPGQEGFQVRSGGRGAAGLGAGGQVVLEQGEGFQAVLGGGGGDGPDVGGQGVVGPVQYGDPLCPRRAPFAQLVGVGGAGPQEVPADVGKAPERVHAVDAGQGLVSPMEVGGDDQAP